MSAEAKDDTRQRYAQISQAARQLLDTGGESGRFEFKRDAKAVSTAVLVAAANWVALSPDAERVTILGGSTNSQTPRPAS